MTNPLIVFDIDGTLTTHISSWRFIHEKLNLWDALARKYQDQFIKGEINYRQFCELDAAHWKGLEIKKIHKAFEEVKYSKNVKKAISILKKHKIKTAAVSTGLQFITEKIKKDLKINYVIGNRLNSYKGNLTGGVKINISHGEKGKILREIAKRFKIKLKDIITVGDTEGDIPMMEISGFSIAFNADCNKVKKAANYVCKTKDFMEVVDILKKKGVFL